MEEPAKSSEKRLDHLGWPSLKEWSHWGVGCTQSENGHAQGNGGCGRRDPGDIWCFIGDCSCPNTEQAGTGGKWPAWGNFHVMRSGRGWRAWWLGRVGNEKWTVVWKKKKSLSLAQSHSLFNAIFILRVQLYIPFGILKQDAYYPKFHDCFFWNGKSIPKWSICHNITWS